MNTDKEHSDEYFTRLGVARYLKVSPRTVSMWQARRIIPAIKLGRKCVRFSRRQIDEAIKTFGKI
jgi:excisionase family DNA binding protein